MDIEKMILQEENKRLKEFIREKLESNCDGCDHFNYSQRAQCYECLLPNGMGKWLGENGGAGCEHNTELKILEEKD